MGAKGESEVSKDIDVTDQVDFRNNDDESLPLIKCVCGARFSPWEFVLSIYRGIASQCPYCKRKLYFKNEIRVFEVREN